MAKAIELSQDRIPCGNKLESSIDDIATKTLTIISEAEARSNVVSAARAAANRTYKSQWAAIGKQAGMIVGYEKRLGRLSADISKACNDEIVDTDALNTAVAGMHSTQKIISQQR